MLYLGALTCCTFLLPIGGATGFTNPSNQQSATRRTRVVGKSRLKSVTQQTLPEFKRLLNSISTTPGVGVSTPYGPESTRGSSFSSPVCWSCRCMEGFLNRGWDLVHPGWRWVHEPQPIRIFSSGVGAFTPCGAVRPRESPFSTPGCVGVVDTWQYFLIRVWDLVLLRWR